MPEIASQWSREHRLEFRRLMGRRVWEARTRLELSQAELARRAFGVCTQASISNYENGLRDIPLMTFVVLAEVLEMDVAELLRRPDSAL